jgi:hypothetical protein
MLGGGANVTQTGNTKAAVAGSYPSSASQWTATSIVVVAGTGNATIQAYAVCGA